MTDADAKLEPDDNVFYITEFLNRAGVIVAYDCEGWINGNTTGIFPQKTGQECTLRYMALEDEYQIEFDKISIRREFVE